MKLFHLFDGGPGGGVLVAAVRVGEARDRGGLPRGENWSSWSGEGVVTMLCPLPLLPPTSLGTTLNPPPSSISTAPPRWG